MRHGPRREAKEVPILFSLMGWIRMSFVNSHEANTHFAKLLEKASRGKRIPGNKEGVPLVILVPPLSTKKKDHLKEARTLTEGMTF